jgi:broad specificity phosphatase PhoE
MAGAELVLVRHGESTGNVAREEAEQSGADAIPVEARDADVPLSPLGHQQAQAFGEWAGAQWRDAPVEVWSSPYARALQTAQTALASAHASWPLWVDERLRDKELGVLDTLTSAGVRRRFPEEDQRRRWLGKFYYRSPGGESWADLVLRIRSFLVDRNSVATAGPTMIFTHDAVIMLFCYVCLGLDERRLLAWAKSTNIGNCSVTRLVRADGTGQWELAEMNAQHHLTGPGGVDLRTEHAADEQVLPQG